MMMARMKMISDRVLLLGVCKSICAGLALVSPNHHYAEQDAVAHGYLRFYQLLTDKHGLVSKFSRVLNENGVNHMYSSTFKTANLLVRSQLCRIILCLSNMTLARYARLTNDKLSAPNHC
jgi:hypothetical protein